MKKTLAQKFSVYSAIGVAGGMTFGATSAEADVIVTDVNMFVTQGQPVGIDFDGDMVDEFVFDLRTVGPNAYGTYSNWAAIEGNGPDDQFVNINPSPNAGGPAYGPNNLAAGDIISAGLSFASGDGPLQMAYTSYLPSANFGAFTTASPSGYIGVQFSVNGSTVFGWVEVRVEGDVTAANFDNASIFIGKIGYEDNGGPTQAGIPEPSSVGLLALGAAGLATRRRKNLKD